MSEIDALEAMAARERGQGHQLLWALIAVALVVLVQPFGEGPWDLGHPTLVWVRGHLLAVVGMGLLTAWVGHSNYRPPGLAGALPVARAPRALLGRFDAATLQRLLDEVVAALAGRPLERPALYVVRSPEGLAASMNAYFLNGMPSRNAVYLGSYLLACASEAEVRAILGHEVAHFYRYQNPLTRAPYVVAASVGVLLAALLGVIFGPGSWVFGVGGVPLVVLPLHLLGVGLVFRRGVRHAHLFEHLADLAGARVAGPEAMINALLRLGARQEVVFRAFEEVAARLEASPDLDPAQAAALVSAALPDRDLGASEARRLVRQALEREAARGADPARSGRAGVWARRRVIERLKATFGRDQAWTILSWQAFDTRVHDGWLDADEIRDLLAALARQPDAALFALTTDEPAAVADDSHPTFTRRVQVVARAVGLE